MAGTNEEPGESSRRGGPALTYRQRWLAYCLAAVAVTVVAIFTESPEAVMAVATMLGTLLVWLSTGKAPAGA